MEVAQMAKRIDLSAPKTTRTSFFSRRPSQDSDFFGRWTEAFARGMGTPWFLVVLSLFSVAWIAWNVYMPQAWRFDSSANGFTALTLVLSLQASLAAPLILLAQNRQDDRDRVQIEQDRQRAERNLTDTEYLAREVVALRLALENVATKEFIEDELRDFLQDVRAEMEQRDDTSEPSITSASELDSRA